MTQANASMGGIALGAAAGVASLGALQRITDDVAGSIQTAASNEQMLVNANALLSSSFDSSGKSLMLNNQQLGTLQTQAQQTAATYGQSMKSVTDAIYDAVSSGYQLKQSADGSSEAMNLVNASAKAAVAGLTSVDTAQSALITSMKAMGLQTSDT